MLLSAKPKVKGSINIVSFSALYIAQNVKKGGDGAAIRGGMEAALNNFCAI